MDEAKTLDEFKLWRVQKLREFVRSRGLKVSLRKDELVALAFAATQMKLPVVPTSEGKDKQKKNEIIELLKIDDVQLPDPKDLDGWIGEKSGIKEWPPCMYFDIADYLRSIDNVELSRRMLSDYKEGKAYSYVKSGWLLEVLYNGIEKESPFCFLKADCVPSQKVRNIPWSAWVCLRKETGTIKSAYCTCFAGLHSTCNHVAAILWKVDMAWRNGLTQASCTSQPCEWNRYGAKFSVEPKRVCDMQWKKHQYSKDHYNENRETNPVARQLFKPISESKQACLDDLVNIILPACPSACFLQYVPTLRHQPDLPESDTNVGMITEVNTEDEEPATLTQLSEKCDTVEQFLKEIPVYSAAQVSRIEELTRKQSACPDWTQRRKGMITSSVIRRVLLKVEKVKTDPTVDSSALVKLIAGYCAPSPNIPALKYGREMESQAKICYTKVMRQFGHASASVKECGLFVLAEYPYLGASPDGIVECSCCGTGLLEVKCPLKTAGLIPDENTVDCLELIDDKLVLKRTHPYFFQVQMQMGLTSKKWCDFFVYSSDGYVRERILFNRRVWNEILNAGVYFFKNILAEELINRKLKC